MRNVFLGIFTILFATAVNAQTDIARYQFAISSGTYTPITGGTVFTSGAYDDLVSAAIPLGGTFSYGSVSFTDCYISANGFITFTATSLANTYTPLFTAASGNSAISAFGVNGAGSTATGAVPEISYANIGGSAGEFVVQFTDHATSSGKATERLNFQIRLNLATGVITIAYGSCTNPGNINTVQVGIRGNTAGVPAFAANRNDLRIINLPAGTSCNWSNAVTAFSSAAASTMLFSTANANINIPNGLIYTWTPATVIAPVRTFAAATAITSSGATINWTAPTGATQYNVQYRLPSSCSWTNFSGNPVSTNSATLTGLVPSTSYQVRVQSSDGTNNAIWSHIPSSIGASDGYILTGSFTTLAVPTDLQAQLLQSPLGNCFSTAHTVTITIRNAGTAAIDFTVNPAVVRASVTGPNSVVFTPVIINTGTLAAAATQDVVFTTTYDMSSFGTYIFNGNVSMTGDGYAANDNMNPVQVTNALTAAPYLQNFTNGTLPPGWTAPAWNFSTAHSVADFGMYRNLFSLSATGQFDLPRVGTLTGTEVLAFDFRILNHGSPYPGSLLPPVGAWGDVKIQASTDCGATFTDIGIIDNTNHTLTDQSFERKVFPLSAYAGQNVILRILATRIAGDFDIDFDNFRVIDLALLPTGLLSFAGQKDGAKNVLHWTTTYESNNRGFEIQRSADGINYGTISFINSKGTNGNSAINLNYSFTDNNPEGKKQYYRLRQVDYDGHSKLSSIVMIKGEKSTMMTIDGLFPNPAQTQLNVMLNTPVRNKVTLSVVDITGRSVMQQAVHVEEGSNTLPLDISRLANGSYIIKITCSGNCENVASKFIKQ